MQVNAAFYRAFSQKNYDEMAKLWLQDGTATCLHPSSKPLVGSKVVVSSWKPMLAAADGSFQRNWMEPKDIRLSVKGASTAVVTCDEYVYGWCFARRQKRQSELLNKLTATNIFRKVEDSKNNNNNPEQPVKRIAMGSLSDIINQNLGDLFHHSDDPSSSSSTNEQSNGAVIHCSNIEAVDNGDDDDYDDDDDTANILNDDNHDPETAVKEWAQRLHY